jgi:hypothetical protein
MLHMRANPDRDSMVDASLTIGLVGFASICHSVFELENA